MVPAVAVGAKGVPVKVGEAIFAFKFKAVCCAVDTGLSASAVLVIFPKPTMDAVIPETVPVKVGESDKTKLPVPVSSVTAVAIFEEVNEPKLVVFPVDVIAPVKLALVVTVAAFPEIEPTIVLLNVFEPEKV